MDELKALAWVGNALRTLKAFPEEVKDVMGYALHLAQAGKKHGATKPLSGFGGAGVLEIVDNHDGDTYRAVTPSSSRTGFMSSTLFRRKPRRASRLPSTISN